jgi:hypothetical protein
MPNGKKLTKPIAQQWAEFVINHWSADGFYKVSQRLEQEMYNHGSCKFMGCNLRVS